MRMDTHRDSSGVGLAIVILSTKCSDKSDDLPRVEESSVSVFDNG